jgi:hypothetical protein
MRGHAIVTPTFGVLGLWTGGKWCPGFRLRLFGGGGSSYTQFQIVEFLRF